MVSEGESVAELTLLRGAIEATPLPVAIVDAATMTYTACNRAMRELLGQDLRGQHVDAPAERLLRATLAGQHAAGRHLPLALALAGESTLDGELVIREGTPELTLLVNCVPVADDSGQILGAIEILHDVTAINEIDRNQSSYLASVGHDLKTPLAAIRLRAELLDSEIDTLTPRRARQRLHRMLQDIIESTAYLSSQADELLDASRLHRGEALRLNRRPTDLVTLIQDAVRAQEGSHSQSIEVRLPSSSVLGQWDGPRIERVLLNLLENACKYSHSGGVVTVDLSLEMNRRRLWAVVKVEDHGIGIPERDLPRIFDPFFRGSNVGGRRRGAGVGLAGVKRLVEQHGGSIAVESHEGAGTVVTVRLPLGRL